jgi:hypothetical protein
VLIARVGRRRQPHEHRSSIACALIGRLGLCVAAGLVSMSALFGADDIHWTVTGPTSVAIDWRGSESTLHYGVTTSYGQSVAAVSQAGAVCDPAAVPENAATGPYYEARVPGLLGNTTYHYKIGSSGADHTFRTAPPAGASGFSVMVEADVGDSAAYPNMATIQGMIAADLPRFVLVVGDMSYKADHGSPADIRHFNDVMIWSQDAAYMPAWGNHEWDEPDYDDLRNYKGRFQLPNPQSTSPNTPTISDCGEDWYWFDYGNTRFIAYPEPAPASGTDSDSSIWTAWYNVMAGPAGPMATAQSDPNIRFIVTFGHRPAYSSGHQAGSSTLKGCLDALGCQYSKYVLNLNGHSHDYERTFPQVMAGCSNAAARGVVHITTGTGGADLEQEVDCLWLTCSQPSWSAARYMRQGITKLTFSPSSIDGRFLCGPAGGGTNDVSCSVGSTIDTFTISSCTGAPNGTACSDGNSCTQSDTCQGGVCTGSNPVVCTASDQCHTAGTCDPSTGICSNPSKSNGTACNDGSACTQTDTCQSGICTGSNPIVCTASDPCHTVGPCSPATGVCSNPTKANGTACDDGNACTQTDTCQSGACTGSSPIVCTASDTCHLAGSCNPATGVCSSLVKANGSSCSDGDACTQTDTCQSGICTGSNPVVCTPSDQCHTAGTCDAATGICSNPSKPDGTICSDGSACTRSDTCESGVCIGSNPVICTASDDCHKKGTCDPATGVCSNPPRSGSPPCDDGNACTQTDKCQDGACVGSNPAPDGTSCDDGNACTTGDACVGGVCTGSGSLVPGEVGNDVEVTQVDGATTVSWIAASGSTSSSVLRGSVDSLPVGPGGDDEVCLVVQSTANFAIDGESPPTGQAYWYLVQGSNACGHGSLGSQLLHGALVPRVSATCP